MLPPAHTPQRRSALFLVLLLGCCVGLTGFSLWSLRHEHLRRVLERRAAQTHDTQRWARQLSEELSQALGELDDLPGDASPAALQKRWAASPWIWHVAVLDRQEHMRWPSYPWEGSDDAKLRAAAKGGSCDAFRQGLRSKKLGLAAVLSASLAWLRKGKTRCSPWPELRGALLFDVHLRSRQHRKWRFTATKASRSQRKGPSPEKVREFWLMEGREHLLLMRFAKGHWMGFALPLRSLFRGEHLGAGRRLWLMPSKGLAAAPPKGLSTHAACSGPLAGYTLWQQSPAPHSTGVWLPGLIAILGLLLALGAWTMALGNLKLQALWEEERQALFSAIAHELKTPVAAQIALLDTLQRADEPMRYWSALRKEASRLHQLVDNLVALNRAASPQKQRVDLTALSRQLLEDMEHLAEAKGQEFQCDEAHPAWILADPAGLELALRNLLDNAIKYAPAEGWIKLELSPTAEAVTWRLYDSGEGVDEALRERIFSPFVRGDRREEMGSGLGLTLARDILAHHGGTLEYLPGPHAQGGFLVTLPLAPTEALP